MRRLALTTAAAVGTLWLSGWAYASETSDAYGTFTDARDGKTYKTVKMSDGKRWMAENLNYKAGESWCYNDDSSNCAKYGRMYDWETAMTACPAGWRLSTYKDWDDLELAVGGDKMTNKDGSVYWGGAGKKLKAKSGWNDFCGNNGKKPCKSGNGTDDFGFSALPGGVSDGDGDGNIGVVAGWWTATAPNGENVRICGLRSDTDNLINQREGINKRDVFSARCVQVEDAHAVTVLRNGAKAKNGGSHAAGDTVTITAGTAPTGKRFKRWTSANRDVVFADARNATTAFIMPANNVTVTAHFDTPVVVVKSGAVDDSRDDQKYKTVIIGGRMWTAENLNYETPEGSWCYDGDNGNCAKYGRLYNKKAAAKACPAGWLLPTRYEWGDLMQTVGGRCDISDDKNILLKERKWYGADKALKTKSGWDGNRGKNNNGTDDYGFSALPGGYFNSDGFFADIGTSASWWTSSGPAFDHSTYGINIYYRKDFVQEKFYFDEMGFSVRCIRDTSRAINKNEEWKQGKEMGQRDDKKKKEIERQKMEEEQRIENLSTYFTDSRDGRRYRAVKIGGYRWMAENLNYEPKSGDSWCQNDKGFFCGKYGRLYDWNTAKKICPSGWRLPSREEWDNLAVAAGGRKGNGFDKGTVEWDGVSGELRSKSGWDPRFSVGWTDRYGFSALPNGRRKSDGSFRRISVDGEAEWWTVTESGGEAFTRWVGYYGDSMRENKLNKSDALPVRCVADNP
jgi:uncharacterized protein (TIGR02145 family)